MRIEIAHIVPTLVTLAIGLTMVWAFVLTA